MAGELAYNPNLIEHFVGMQLLERAVRLARADALETDLLTRSTRGAGFANDEEVPPDPMWGGPEDVFFADDGGDDELSDGDMPSGAIAD